MSLRSELIEILDECKAELADIRVEADYSRQKRLLDELTPTSLMVRDKLLALRINQAQWITTAAVGCVVAGELLTLIKPTRPMGQTMRSVGALTTGASLLSEALLTAGAKDTKGAIAIMRGEKKIYIKR